MSGASDASFPPASEGRTYDWSILVFLVVASLICMGSAAEIENYGRDTTTYLLLAQSILRDHSYQFNFELHTVYPPGFPLLLSGFMALGVQSFGGLVKATIPVYFAGLFGVYHLVRLWRGRRTAAAVTLLTGSSYTAFFWTTVGLHSEIPYFTCSVAALACVEVARRSSSRVTAALAAGLGALLVAYLPMVRTIGVSFALGLGLWMVYPMLAFRIRTAESRFVRIKRWAPAVALAAAVLVSWTYWGKRHEPAYAGDAFMGSYVEQVLKSDPHQLDSPSITLTEMPSRILRVLATRTQRGTQALLNQPTLDLSYKSPISLLVLALMLFGFARSFLAGATVLDCYVLVYMGTLLVWPFDEGSRFLFPILPFLFLYAMDGLNGLYGHMESRLPRRLVPGDRVFGVFKAVALAMIVGSGLFHSAVTRGENRHLDPTTFRNYPTVLAAEWVRENAAADAVVIHEQNAIMHRLTGRRTYRFPLITDPDDIRDLIAENGVDYVVVLDERPYEYFNPSTMRRFEAVLEVAPEMFQLIHKFESGTIYQVQTG